MELEHGDMKELRQTLVDMAVTQRHGLELHARTYGELQHVSETLGHVHKQVLATNGRVNEHDTDIAALNKQMAELQAREQWRLGALAAPRAVLSVLKQQRALQVLMALAVVIGAGLSLPNWVVEAIKIVINALATPTP